MPLPTDQAPLEPRRSTAEELDRIKRAHNALERDHHAQAAKTDSAFVGGDYLQHHREHEEVQRKRMADEKFRQDLKVGTVKSLVWVVLCFVGWAVWEAIKQGVQR